MKNKILFATVIFSVFLANFSYAQGCMEPKSDDGVSVIGFIQPQYNYSFFGEDDNGKNLNESTFLFNRARIGVTGTIPYDFSYYAMTEFSPTLGGPMLLDYFITWKRLGKWANLSVGQFKQPFGLELSTACHKLHTINRSRVANELASPFRDLGVMVSGKSGDLSIAGLDNENLIQYQLAYVNGCGLNNVDTVTYKDIVGRVVLSPFEFISVGGSYRTGKKNNPDPSIEKADERTRWGADISIDYANFLIQGEYISGTDKGSKIVGGGGCGGGSGSIVPGTFESNGFAALLLYKTPWNIQPLIKYESYDPNVDEDYDKESTITFGINYFFNEWTRLQINYLYNAEESSDSDPSLYNEYDNDMLMVQLQVVF